MARPTPKIIDGAEPDPGLSTHDWPKPGEHLWSGWRLNTSRDGAKPATKYRICLHPKCNATEVRGG